jgi:hypothetical protein
MKTLEDEAGELVDNLGLRETMNDLKLRLNDGGSTASGKLTGGILKIIGAKDPLSVSASEFNNAAERYYRTGLCDKHMHEALAFLMEDFSSARPLKEGEKTIMNRILGSKDAVEFLKEVEPDVVNDRITEEALGKLISLVVLSVHFDTIEALSNL